MGSGATTSPSSGDRLLDIPVWLFVRVTLIPAPAPAVLINPHVWPNRLISGVSDKVHIVLLFGSIGLALLFDLPAMLLAGCCAGGVWGLLRCARTRQRLRAGSATTLDVVLETGNTSFREIASHVPEPDHDGFVSVSAEDLSARRRRRLLYPLMVLHALCSICALVGTGVLIGGMLEVAWGPRMNGHCLLGRRCHARFGNCRPPSRQMTVD